MMQWERLVRMAMCIDEAVIADAIRYVREQQQSSHC